MEGQGSAGNVLAALCSFFIPGLGQLLQGRPLIALFQFVFAAPTLDYDWHQAPQRQVPEDQCRPQLREAQAAQAHSRRALRRRRRRW